MDPRASIWPKIAGQPRVLGRIRCCLIPRGICVKGSDAGGEIDGLTRDRTETVIELDGATPRLFSIQQTLLACCEMAR
jgi:hypothetical protein